MSSSVYRNLEVATVMGEIVLTQVPGTAKL